MEYFASLLFIKLRSRIRSAQDVDDLLQQVFFRVFRTLRQNGNQPECLGGYVNNVCDDVISEYYGERGPVTQYQGSPLPNSGAGVEAKLVSEESVRHIRAVLAELPMRDREVLRTVFVEERTIDAVCGRFGVRREELPLLLHRANVRFRALLRTEKTLIA